MPDYYKRRLPHIQPKGHTFFVTYRLQDSIPKEKLLAIQEDYETNRRSLIFSVNNEEELKEKLLRAKSFYFKKYDEVLDKVISGHHYLKNVRVLEVIKEHFHKYDGALYDLICFCIMSNHVHVLIDTYIQFETKGDEANHIDLKNILKRIKGPTARYANRILKRSGKFWQKESWDTYIRNEKMYWNVIRYILNNPVKAGIVLDWKNYNGTYLKPALNEFID